MKINKRWHLNGLLKPMSYSFLSTKEATKKQFDSVAIIHYPSDLSFRPIVLYKDGIISEDYWGVVHFYDGVLEAIKLCRHLHYPPRRDNKGYYISYYHSDIIEWGCRKFTIRQLLLIKRTMEQEYTKKQLGAR